MFPWTMTRELAPTKLARTSFFAGIAPWVALCAACNPYNFKKGEEYNAGPLDAANFPRPYQGAGQTTGPYGYNPGQGTFNEINAYVNGADAGYFSFPFTQSAGGSGPRQLDRGNDPLRLLEDGNPYSPSPTPLAYVFDPRPPASAFPLSPLCTPPPNYVYDFDNDTEGMRLDDQSNIFTSLPLATETPGQANTWTYIPVVREIALSAGGWPCQSFKSESKVQRTFGDLSATGNYLLWAIIDPSSGVYRLGQVGGSLSRYTLPDGGHNPAWSRGVGVQKWGWFGQYYLAYIDGGYIPTVTATVTEGNPARQKQVVRMQTQPLYIPRTQVTTSSSSTPVDPNIGQGYDVLTFRRSDPGYSPVCEVWTYPVSTNPPPLISSLPKSASAITGATKGPPNPTVNTTVPPYVYCPQVE